MVHVGSELDNLNGIFNGIDMDRLGYRSNKLPQESWHQKKSYKYWVNSKTYSYVTLVS